MKPEWLGVKPAASRLGIRCPNHYADMSHYVFGKRVVVDMLACKHLHLISGH